jgi:hypothetical protein
MEGRPTTNYEDWGEYTLFTTRRFYIARKHTRETTVHFTRSGYSTARLSAASGITKQHTDGRLFISLKVVTPLRGYQQWV